MEISKGHSHSHLFLLRLWSEDESNLQGEWSARIQHIFSGETHTFQACPQIVAILLKLMRGDTGQAEEAKGH
jgi:hypothetical protein